MQALLPENFPFHQFNMAIPIRNDMVVEVNHMFCDGARRDLYLKVFYFMFICFRTICADTSM